MAQRGSRPNNGFSVRSVQRSMNLRSYAVRERSQRCEDEERMRQTRETRCTLIVCIHLSVYQ
eukprot:635986-Pleurochrysis_carterae.AAC.1